MKGAGESGRIFRGNKKINWMETKRVIDFSEKRLIQLGS